jgi:hypothetical protein
MPSYDPRKKSSDVQRGASRSKNEYLDDDDDADADADDVFGRSDGASVVSSAVNSSYVSRLLSHHVPEAQKYNFVSPALANKLLRLHEQVLVSKPLSILVHVLRLVFFIKSFGFLSIFS